MLTSAGALEPSVGHGDRSREPSIPSRGRHGYHHTGIPDEPSAKQISPDQAIRLSSDGLSRDSLTESLSWLPWGSSGQSPYGLDQFRLAQSRHLRRFHVS